MARWHHWEGRDGVASSGRAVTSATIRDVARVAGVSVATVSRVLDGSAPVSEMLRGRIHEAARELRYVPNGAARSLGTRATHTLGMLLPGLSGESSCEVIRGADRAAPARGFPFRSRAT